MAKVLDHMTSCDMLGGWRAGPVGRGRRVGGAVNKGRHCPRYQEQTPTLQSSAATTKLVGYAVELEPYTILKRYVDTSV